MEKKDSKKDILETALKRFKLMIEANTEIYDEAKKDLMFVKGDHWPEDVLNARQLDNRPCLVINKLPMQIRQVTNDQRQNRPSIIVNPVDDYADIDTAEVLQGIIRNIENVSDAEYAYDKAFECAARSSFGFFRITTQYASEESFDLEARIETIDNQFKAGIDPYSVLPDGSDAKWGFVWDTMPKEDFIAQYGESKLAKHQDWDGLANDYKGWCGQDDVRIAEYFFKEEKRVKLFELSDGKTYLETDLPKKNDDGTYSVQVPGLDPISGQVVPQMQKLSVERERWTKTCKVRWVKLNAIEVLEETDWPGSYIPIIPVYGDCLNVDGQVVRESVIRHARDSQRILNYWASAEAEAIALAPKSPFIGAEGQFKGHEAKWAAANIKNFPYLEYRPITHDGQALPPPMRNQFEPPVMAITQARMQANEDIKATTGIYDASLGGRSNETSGIAIQRRNQQAQTSNFHFIDNLSKSIRHAGRILVEIIPKIYDTERIVRVLGQDGEQRLIRINSERELEGQKRAYSFSYGKYDVTVSTGPSYETRRQEARDSMLQMSQANPQFAQVAGDLLVKNMDWPGAQEIAERIKKTMPPEIVSDDQGEMPPQAQQAIAQLTQQLEMTSQELNQLKAVLEKDLLAIESKERIETMKIQADLRKELLKIEGGNSQIMLKGDIERLNRRLEQLEFNRPIEAGEPMEQEEPEEQGEQLI